MPRAEKYYPNASQVLSGSRKKHVCSTCERAFTTSGHLARHTRVHTGERNHKCPFPGCETRCSRQDNLQQHYRIHMSPGSRRNSARARKRAAVAGTLSSSSTTTITETTAPPSPPGRGSTQTPPPGSPPPLTHATLPATASLTLAPAARLIASSPDRHLISPHALTLTAPLNYSYRTAVNAYPYAASSFHGSFTTRNPSSISATSRLSISHLSNPHYPPSQPASTNPPSPASVSSQASPPSAPPTPSYHHVSYNDSHSYPHQLAHSHFHTQPHLTLQTSYASTRFNSSPPPTLAPIQDERYIRRQEPRILQQSHQSSPYIHHPQPLSDYSYHHSIALSHGAWKTDSIRKGVGPAAVI